MAIKMLLEKKNTGIKKIYVLNHKMSLIHSSIKTHSDSFQSPILDPRTAEISINSLSLVKCKKSKASHLLPEKGIQASKTLQCKAVIKCI